MEAWSSSVESPEAKTSPYAHVFLEPPDASWPKLTSDKALSMFHAKYWGKGILEDKRKWLETQNGGHRMDTDEAPANFALYFNIAGLNPSNLWVREDYMLLYDECMAYFNRPRVKSSAMPPSVVITGQPGIGK